MTAAAIARAVRADNERIRRESCATCGDRCAPFTCDWACDVPTRIHPRGVRVGDVVITPQSRREAPVIDVRGGNGCSYIVTVEYRHGRRKPPYPQFSYERYESDWIHVLRPGRCGARCCERHVRDVGEGRHHCRAHWRAWSGAA